MPVHTGVQGIIRARRLAGWLSSFQPTRYQASGRSAVQCGAKRHPEGTPTAHLTACSIGCQADSVVRSWMNEVNSSLPSGERAFGTHSRWIGKRANARSDPTLMSTRSVALSLCIGCTVALGDGLGCVPQAAAGHVRNERVPTLCVHSREDFRVLAQTGSSSQILRQRWNAQTGRDGPQRTIVITLLYIGCS